MKLITRQTLADEAPARFAHQHPSFLQRAMRAMLAELPTPVNPDEVDRIIGNKSWSRVRPCDECKGDAESLVQLGDEPDYESHTASICRDCLAKALLLATE